MNHEATQYHGLTRRQVQLVCLVLGAFAAVVMGLSMNHRLPPASQVSMQEGRLVDMQRSIQVLDHGGPPLLGVNPAGSPKVRAMPTPEQSLSSHTRIAGLSGQLYAVGPGDDQGMYLYVGLLGHYLGQSDPRQVLRVMYISLAVLAAFIYPLLFFEIFGSLLVAVIAPAALWYILRDAIPLVDVYWAPALVLLIAVPLLFALKGRRQWVVVGGLAVVCLLASLNDSIRSYTGAGLFIAAAIAAFRWTTTWRHRAAALGLAAIAVLAVYPIALDGARSYRDHEIHASLVTSSSATHPFWHQIYLGLSYIQPNRFGIDYSDTDGFVTAVLYDPRVVAQSPAYERDVEHAFASVVASDPGYALADYAEKSTSVVGTAVHLYLAGLVVCAMALLFWKGHRREMVIMWLPILFVTALPPILTVPLDEYELPWLAMAGLAVFFALCGPVASVEYWATNALRTRNHPAGRYLPVSEQPDVIRRQRLPVVPVVIVAIAVIAAGAVLDHDSRVWNARFNYSADATLTQLSSELPTGQAVAHWSFGQGGATWSPYPGAHVTVTTTGDEVRTGASPSGYELASPKISLAPGRYVLEIHGAVREGGMSAGILDLSQDLWLGGATGNFWYAQTQGPGYVMALEVTNHDALPVQVVLSNWHPGGGSSNWSISSVLIARAA